MKEEFKEFVRKNPTLVSHVNHGDMTWQKFYEMYDLYGADHHVWNDYNQKSTPKEEEKVGVDTEGAYGLNDVVNYVKKMDSNKLRGHINSAQKFLGSLQDFVGKDTAKAAAVPKISNYIPRPIYRHFED